MNRPALKVVPGRRSPEVMPAGTMIHMAGVAKRFRKVEAVRGVDLSIAEGRVTAVVGPNAAGKSTLIKMILGLVRADEGRILVQGIPLDGSADYRRLIGYMPQAARFPENLTGREVLRMLTDLRSAEVDTDTELFSRFGLERELGKPVRTLSGGTRQKLSAAIAFLFRPAILILDEPTSGLDPVASSHLKDKIREARERGVTVILASHIMSELEELADDLVLLLEGRVRYHGPVRRLAERTGFHQLERAVASLMGREE
ncbi:MAG: ABC transporter ATP-binding protein [Gemmatimonadales bacterium]